MNGWLIGLCFTLWFLATHTVFSRIQFGNMIRVFAAISDLLGTISGLPEEKVNELKATWAVQRDKMQSSITKTGLCWLAITVFLIALAIRGHL